MWPWVVLLSLASAPASADAPLSVRGPDGGTTTLRILRGEIGAEPTVFVADDARVWFTFRARDFVGIHTAPHHAGHDLIAIELRSGGPGTCVWQQHLEFYVLEEEGPVEVFTAPSGGYLECADGRPRACGCGTWEADWRVERSARQTELHLRPRRTYRERGFPPGPPPPRSHHAF